MIFTGQNVARVLDRGWAAAAFTSPYDGVSAVEVDERGMVNSLLPIGRDPRFAMAIEVGGRAMNLLDGGRNVCAHGLVNACAIRFLADCDCGIEPIGRNPERVR